MKFRLEIETWNCNLKSKLEIWIWNQNLKSKLEIKTWNQNLKSKLEIETWILKIETINFGFGSTALSFVFNTFIFEAPSALYLALRSFIFGPLRLFLGSRSGSNTFLEPTNVYYQFLFWKYSPIFFFLIRPKFWDFLHFLGPLMLFLGLRSDSKTFLATAYID